MAPPMKTNPCSPVRQALLQGNSGNPYSNQLTIGTSPFPPALPIVSWLVTAGSLPPGAALGLNTGLIDSISIAPGIPLPGKDYYFTITATDTKGCKCVQDFSLFVAQSPN